MEEAIAAVATGAVTVASRDVDLDGLAVRKGDWLALSEGDNPPSISPSNSLNKPHMPQASSASAINAQFANVPEMAGSDAA